MARRTPQSLIASLMLEDPGMTSILSGANTAKSATEMPMSGIEYDMIGPSDYGTQNEGGEEKFQASELKIAKRFIELLGGYDRAREAIQKVNECMDCLDIVDDDQNQINNISQMIPNEPDLPTSMQNKMSTRSMFNPNGNSGNL